MRRSGNNLIKSLVILILALGFAGATTYAWISNNDSANIGGFNLEIKGDSNLLISLSGQDGSFKSSISKAQIENYLGENFKLIPVTTANGKTFTDIDNTVVGEGYATITLYFQSNVKKDIFLKPDSLSTYVSSQRRPGAKGNVIDAWKDIETVYGQNAVISYGDKVFADAMNAARVSFISKDNEVTWYPNPDKGFKGDYNIDGVADFTAYSLSTDYLKEVFGYNIAVPAEYQTLCSRNYYEKSTGNYIIADNLLTLEFDEASEFYRGELTINIWLEGWDGDCFDSIVDDILNISLEFTSSVVIE